MTYKAKLSPAEAKEISLFIYKQNRDAILGNQGCNVSSRRCSLSFDRFEKIGNLYCSQGLKIEDLVPFEYLEKFKRINGFSNLEKRVQNLEENLELERANTNLKLLTNNKIFKKFIKNYNFIIKEHFVRKNNEFDLMYKSHNYSYGYAYLSVEKEFDKFSLKLKLESNNTDPQNFFNKVLIRDLKDPVFDLFLVRTLKSFEEEIDSFLEN